MEELEQPPDHAEAAFHPPILLLAAIGLGFLLREIVPLAWHSGPFLRLVGKLLALASFTLFGWAGASMLRRGASLPTHLPTEMIVVSGPFRFSRNPIYTAMVLLLISLGFWANSLWFFLFAGFSFFLLQEYVIKREERYLERKFSDSYMLYKTRVRRWL